MNFSTANMFGRWRNFLGTLLVIVLTVPTFVLSQFANPGAVDLLTAGTYGALAYSGITGSATVHGDVGTSTATIGGSITATGTNWGVGGTHNSDAQNDLNAALTDAGGRSSDAVIASDVLGGLVLGRGVYSGGALALATGTTLTLNGSATDVFIIQAASTLTVNANSTISLTGGAVWNNVFWYVGSSATIFSGSTFNGIILAGSSITVNVGATLVTAKLLANTAAVTINSDVLPVELVSFTASVHHQNANLNWSTATEVNNYGFEIERTEVINQKSEVGWNKVGFVEGNGTTNSPKFYNFVDANVQGKVAYRLKQIDRDGKFVYSQSVEAVIGQEPKEFGLVQNYPNPFNPTTTISYQLPAGSHVSLKVFDAIGKEVATLVSGFQDAGNHTVPFTAAGENISALPSGIYFYRLQAGSFVATKKLILMK